jgi:phosphate starvation-inducible protein PhoH and related proteins
VDVLGLFLDVNCVDLDLGHWFLAEFLVVIYPRNIEVVHVVVLYGCIGNGIGVTHRICVFKLVRGYDSLLNSSMRLLLLGVMCMPFRAASYTSSFVGFSRGIKHVSQCRSFATFSRRKSAEAFDVGGEKYIPRGEKQRDYVRALKDPSVGLVFGIGPAGCGKTLFACNSAVAALKSGSVSKIVLTRPSVAADEQLGFLPGDILKKMNPMMLPLFDVFLEHFPKWEWDRMIASGVVEIAPIGFMRGRTFKECFVIADEMQNSTPNQMLMLLTRLGEGSKMVVTGDLRQSDIGGGIGGSNGLQDVLDRIYHGINCDDDLIRVVEMGDGDVERSDIVKRVLEIYKDD